MIEKDSGEAFAYLGSAIRERDAELVRLREENRLLRQELEGLKRRVFDDVPFTTFGLPMTERED